MEHWRDCAGTEKYYRSTREAVLVQRSIIGVLERLCRYRRVLYDNWEGCVGTAEYYMSSQEAVLVQWSTA